MRDVNEKREINEGMLIMGKEMLEVERREWNKSWTQIDLSPTFNGQINFFQDS